jgi:hypothetical protein
MVERRRKTATISLRRTKGFERRLVLHANPLEMSHFKQRRSLAKTPM